MFMSVVALLWIRTQSRDRLVEGAIANKQHLRGFESDDDADTTTEYYNNSSSNSHNRPTLSARGRT
jgi:hypothetical protein